MVGLWMALAHMQSAFEAMAPVPPSTPEMVDIAPLEAGVLKVKGIESSSWQTGIRDFAPA